MCVRVCVLAVQFFSFLLVLGALAYLCLDVDASILSAHAKAEAGRKKTKQLDWLACQRAKVPMWMTTAEKRHKNKAQEASKKEDAECKNLSLKTKWTKIYFIVSKI